MGSPSRGWVAATALAALATTVPVAQAARPNLVTAKVANPPKTAVVGGSFRVDDVVRNRGARAGRSATRYYLSADRKRGLDDLLMVGARQVPALARGEGSRAPKRRRAKAMVAVGTPLGEYFLLACADDREAVRESKEGDNCRAARRKVRTTQPLNAPVLRFDAFMDTTPSPDPATDAQQLAGQKSFRCAPRPKARVPGLEKAIGNVKAAIESRVGKADYAAFKRSKDYKTAKAAQRAAAGAFLFEQPGAALAAMVRAHELEPKEASHLVNAAGLASSVGLPHEALAMLDAAARLDDRDRPAMGISRQAVALANEAHALTSIGRYGDAVKLADAALAIEPLLAEAQQTAGMAGLCATGGGQAAQTPQWLLRIRQGRKRQPAKDPPLDDSKGVESSMRRLPLGATPAQAVELVDFYREEQGQKRLAALQQRQQQEMERQQRINSRTGDPSRYLQSKLLHAVRMVPSEPRFQAMRTEIGQLFDKSHSWWQEKWCEGDSCHDEEYAVIASSCDGAEDRDACIREKCIPATQAWHKGWAADNAALYQKSQEYFRALSKRMSALASHISDADTYDLALLAIESQEDSLYFGAQEPAFYWADWTRRHQEHCVEAPEPPPSTDGTDPTKARGSGPCPDGLKSVNAVLDLGIVSFKMNCSEIQVGGSLGAGWLKGFAELTYDFRSGKTTIFAGAQGEVGAGPLKGDFKSGIYVTGTSQGIEDVGMRAGPSTSIGAGPAEFSGPSDSVDISFVAAFSGT